MHLFQIAIGFVLGWVAANIMTLFRNRRLSRKIDQILTADDENKRMEGLLRILRERKEEIRRSGEGILR